MGKRGPKAKPTALKILEGCKPYRINFDEPKYAPSSDVAPDWLEGLALEHWNELAPILSDSRILTVGDRAALAVLCDDYGRLRADPCDSKARDRYRRMLVEFGLTPSSRSRIKVPPKTPGDDLDNFLERKA